MLTPTGLVVFEGIDERLVDTNCRAYRALVPIQKLLDSGVNPEFLKQDNRCLMGNDKVLHTPFLFRFKLSSLGLAYNHVPNLIRYTPQPRGLYYGLQRPNATRRPAVLMGYLDGSFHSL